jgi:hypothetical protein
VRDLSNEQMLKMMVRENMEEWGASAWVELESIRSTIDAYGKGLITLPAVPEKTPKKHLRYVLHDGEEHPYTVMSVASFLGFTRPYKDGLQATAACRIAFEAIDLIDAGLLKEETTKGKNRKELAAILEVIRQRQEAHERLAKQDRERAHREQARAGRGNWRGRRETG